MEDGIIPTLLRNNQYINSLYIIKEEIPFTKTTSKIYGFTKQNNCSVVITKETNITTLSNTSYQARLASSIKLIEQNLLLVENLWLEEVSPNNYTLYISEFTKSTYRNDFNLITLSYYLNETKGVELSTNMKILINLLNAISVFHTKYNIAHLALSPNNIYINKSNFDIVLGPCRLVTYDEWNLWYLPPEHCYIEKIINEDLQSGIYCDIWSIGCVLSEMFFVVCPLFQAFSQREKMKKIIDVLGIPQQNDVDYMTRQEFGILQSADKNLEKSSPKIFDIFTEEELEKGNEDNIAYKTNNRNNIVKKKIFDIMKKCFDYNRFNRIGIETMINTIQDIDDRYIKSKPIRKGVKTIINRDNLYKENAPLSFSNKTNNEILCTTTNYRSKKESPSTQNNIYSKTSKSKSDLPSPSYRTQQTSNRLNKEPSYPLNNTNIIDYSKYSTNTNNDYPKYYNDKDNFTLTRDKKYTNTDINVDDYLGKKNKIEDSDDEYNNLHEQLDDLVDYISKLKQSE